MVTGATGKVIKTRDEYDSVLAEIDRLVTRDPDPGTTEADRLEILTVLARDYESRTLPRITVDPVDAIQFRMEQQGLRQRDLVPYLGSKSKVSEVLARKRPLTLSMIRALHSGLGIPAESLLGEKSPSLLQGVEDQLRRTHPTIPGTSRPVRACPRYVPTDGPRSERATH